VLESGTIFSYKCDNFYSKESEGGILFTDPALGIDWQVPTDKMMVSDKDFKNPLLQDCLNNFEFAP
jgi:dTDP-4-dehydrorhamnose 3,5-epimerase